VAAMYPFPPPRLVVPGLMGKSHNSSRPGQHLRLPASTRHDVRAALHAVMYGRQRPHAWPGLLIAFVNARGNNESLMFVTRRSEA